MLRDILTEEGTNKLRIEGGDFVLGNPEQQNVNFILLASKGNIYATPEIGVGLIKFLNSPGTTQKLKNEVRNNLEFDSYRNISIEILEDGKLLIDAKRQNG